MAESPPFPSDRACRGHTVRIGSPAPQRRSASGLVLRSLWGHSHPEAKPAQPVLGKLVPGLCRPFQPSRRVRSVFRQHTGGRIVVLFRCLFVAHAYCLIFLFHSLSPCVQAGQRVLGVLVVLLLSFSRPSPSSNIRRRSCMEMVLPIWASFRNKQKVRSKSGGCPSPPNKNRRASWYCSVYSAGELGPASVL